MPTFTNGPGVYVNEALTSNFIRPVANGPVAAFFGTAARGPETATLVTDWVSYKKLFGDLEDTYDLGYSVYHFFANGGRNAYIVRVIPTDTEEEPIVPTASSASFGYYPTDASASAESVVHLLDVDAISVGTWGNSLSVEVSNGLTLSTFAIAVKYGTTEVERWPELSLDPNSSRYVATIVNTYSQYIKVHNVAGADPDVGFGREDTLATFATAYTTLASGTQGDSLRAADWSDAFDKIDLIEGDMVWNAVGLTLSDASSLSTLVGKAETRGNAFVVIDPSKGLTSAVDILSESSPLSSFSSKGYAAYYAPCLKMVDPAKRGPGAIRVTYPGGAIVGMMARLQVQRSVAVAPAGYKADIVGAIGLETVISSADIGTMYENASNPINTFKAIPGAGISVYGARTLNISAPDKFIPVRRTLNYLKHQLKERSAFAVFEPNDTNLWLKIGASLSGFLTDFYQSGGLKGNSPAEAYYVICDSTNNTATSIDEGIVNIEVGVSLLYPAEYIVLNISQWTGGSSSAEAL